MMKHRIFLIICFLITIIIPSCEESKELNVSVLIRNATIIDGTGSGSFQGDIWIIDKKIAGVGKAPININTENEIDAEGKVLAPGFIDIHAHGDPYGESGDFRNFLSQGVTTICLGLDGFSTENLPQWINSAQDSGFAVNIAMFTGHSSIRNESGIGFDTDPSTEQVETMAALLKSALSKGSFGLSLGLEYRPGSFADVNELRVLAETAGKYKALIMSHVRNEDNDQVETSINELLALGKFTPVHISHIKVVYGKGADRAKEILDLLDSSRNAGIEITADIYPYTASYTGIGILFPDWAKAPNDYEVVKAKRRADLREYLLDRVEKRNGPEATLIGTGKWKGLNLKEMEEQESRPWVDILIDDIGPDGASGAYFIMDDELQTKLLINPHIAIASDGSPTMNHPRGYGTFPKVIRKYVREDSMLTLSEAVRKMTSLPAEILGLEDRGRIEEGMVADLILFDPLKFTDNASYETPYLRASGICHMIIDGKVVIMNNEIYNINLGQLLTKNRN